MGPQFPTDYDQYAATYAWARWAVPWVLEPLSRVAGGLPAGAMILEAGCGTGNYICALAERHRTLRCIGFDRSTPMLAQARSRGCAVEFATADATDRFPCQDRTCALVFAVDVVHHLDALAPFFAEARRVLDDAGRLVIVTDSPETMRQRSLTRFFPEILALEQARYPDPERLEAAAQGEGFRLVLQEDAVGEMPLDDAFIASLQARCASAMRLLPDEVHEAGMARVREARAEGLAWRSHYVILQYA
jgi:SAM-dependent methyltransferase